MATRRSIYSTAKRTGGKKKSTNAEFEQDVQTRLYGSTGAKGTISRVAAARSENVPEQIAYEVNKRGGRNALRIDPNGTLTEHEARKREIEAAFGIYK